MQQILSAQTWNSTQYAQNAGFVASMATQVVDVLDPRPGERILDAGCPTPLPGGSAGMERWLHTFRNGVFDLLPDPSARPVALAQALGLLRPILFDSHQNRGDASALWSADYVRLRFRATR